MTASDSPHPYNQEFFDNQADGSLRSARIILQDVFHWLHPRSVADVGCGVGSWLRVASELGATRVIGFDGDYVDRQRLMVGKDEFVPVNLEQDSVVDHLPPAEPRSFDLAMSLEVGEHLPLARARVLVSDLTSLSDVVLFSAAVPFQAGSHHVNEQWPEFWAILFREHGFECFDVLRARIWNNREVEWWYAQNSFLYVRSGSSAENRVLAIQRDESRPLSIVHPENFLFQVLNAFRPFRKSARVEEVGDYHSLVDAHRARASLPELLAARRAESAPPGSPDVFPLTRTTVSDPEEEIAWRDRVLSTRDAELAVTRDLLTTRNDQLESTRDLLSTRFQELTATREILTARSDELNKANQALHACRASLDLRSRQLEVARSEVQAIQNELAQARQILTTIEQSLSWKLTTPIRRLSKAMRRSI